jgi:hypothetical protein
VAFIPSVAKGHLRTSLQEGLGREKGDVYKGRVEFRQIIWILNIWD